MVIPNDYFLTLRQDYLIKSWVIKLHTDISGGRNTSPASEGTD